ncbi:radical SAM protein [Streptomyces sp. NEAU-YJ-81]|uniref:radical SAM protein n=1 Tax=Streptomyces sp. NEAU-YJ-81 TaxID=2820288 RepID=UPI001FBB515E|nr:radical SAM protein [Streptomyces sp. NEAU-YJ-81]
MTARPIITGAQASSRYFRISVDHPRRNALVQACEPCNEKCAHCFVLATHRGEYMPLDDIRKRLILQLAEVRVNRVTITEGEPFMHADYVS